MNNTTKDYRGGDIELSASKPRGLPFLKPLYGLPPYQYTGDILLMIVYEAPEAAIREVLPRELEPLPGNVVAMCFFICPEVTGLGPHNFTMPCIPVRCGEYAGQFVPYLYTSTDASLAGYREGQGWPAVLGDTEISDAGGGNIKARVVRNGREVMHASAIVGGDKITSLDFLPIILYKEIPNIDGTSCDVAYFMTSTSVLTNLNFQAGNGELSFSDFDDPISRLKPVKISTALFGTLDDYYPESVRILKNLK
jgi:acetoacetate decarboxylase